jgi:hypothetical protein
MLSRTAENLFWITRYMERGETMRAPSRGGHMRATR